VSGVLSKPWDVQILNFCGKSVGFLINAQTSELVKLDFGSSIVNAPTAVNYGNTGSLSFPHCISRLFRVGPDLYSFIPNVNNNSLTRLRFEGCTNASIPNSTSQTPGPITYSTPGTYNINLTIDDGLPTQAAYCRQVVVLPPPVHKSLQTFSICQGDSVRVGTTAGMPVYKWSTGETTDSLKIKVAGIYWVEASKYGCTNRDSFDVKSNPKAAMSVSSAASVCSGDSIQLTASGASSYVWSPAANLSNASIANPVAVVTSDVTYMVTGKNVSGCNAFDSVKISALQKPAIISTKDTSLCGNGSVQLVASGAQQYQWTPSMGLSNAGISNPVAAVTADVRYIVTGTAANGCKSSDTTAITLLSKPVVTVSKDTAVCEKQSVQLLASGAQQYQWTPATGLTSAAVANPMLTVTSSLAYIVTGTAANGCSSSDTVNITMNSIPALSVSADTLICSRGVAHLRAAGAQQYLWSPATGLNNTAGPNPDATPVANTKYYVTGTNSNGCEAKDSVMVNVKPSPIFQVSPLSSEVCFSKSLQLAATGGDTYVWQPAKYLSNANISNPVAQPDSSIIYSVNITDTVCNLRSTLTVPITVNQSPKINVSKSNDVTCNQPSSQLRATGASTYLWSPAGGINNASISDPLAVISTTTTFSVVGTSSKGCQSTDSIKVNFVNNGDLSTLQVPNSFTPNGDGLNDCFGIRHWGNVEIISFTIYNRWGEPVFTTKKSTDCWNGTYKGIQQQTGAFPYILRVKTACGDVERKGLLVLIK
jgi:gliding motility-associated-like protein